MVLCFGMWMDVKIYRCFCSTKSRPCRSPSRPGASSRVSGPGRSRSSHGGGPGPGERSTESRTGNCWPFSRLQLDPPEISLCLCHVHFLFENHQRRRFLAWTSWWVVHETWRYDSVFYLEGIWTPRKINLLHVYMSLTCSYHSGVWSSLEITND